MTYYHVAPADYAGDDLLSLYAQHGDEAYDLYATRWPEAGELAQYHVHYIHLYATLDDAREHVEAFGGGVILEVDAAGLEVEKDVLEFAHPMIRDVIPAACIKVAA